MNQAALDFDTFTRTGTSIVPPSREELARQRRDTGMHRAADHAERVYPDWQDRAVGYVRLHATVHTQFMAETVRAVAEADGLTLPPDGRAWGAVMRRAQREGIIRADGYAPANSSNRSPKVRWASMVAG